MNLVGGKRPFEGSIEAEAPAPKRAAPNKNEEIRRFCKWGETEIPFDVLSYLIPFLPKRDIFRFSAVAKGAGALTEASFKEIKQQKQWNFSFPGHEKESYPERASYISICVLSKYLDKREALIKTPHPLSLYPRPPAIKIEALYQEFRSIMRYQPRSLRLFIWYDLTNMAPLQSQQDENLFLGEPSSQTSENAPPASLAGRELLKGLSDLTEYCNFTWISGIPTASMPPLYDALPHLDKAMRSGATIASYFAIKILSPLSSVTNRYCIKLALSASSYKDYQGLELLLIKNIIDPRQAYQQGMRHPPILAYLALRDFKMDSINAKKLKPLFEEAIQGYGDSFSAISARLCLYAGINSGVLSEDEKQKEYLEEALKQKDFLHGKQRRQLWCSLIDMKMHSEKWNEAETYITELLITGSLYGIPLKPLECAKIALIKAVVKKWEEANLYLDQALSNPNGDQQNGIWRIAANIKSLDERWEEAEQLMQKYLDSVNPASNKCLAGMAKIKLNLKKLPEAKTYIDKALAGYQAQTRQVPPDVKKLADKIYAQYSLFHKPEES